MITFSSERHAYLSIQRSLQPSNLGNWRYCLQFQNSLFLRDTKSSPQDRSSLAAPGRVRLPAGGARRHSQVSALPPRPLLHARVLLGARGQRCGKPVACLLSRVTRAARGLLLLHRNISHYREKRRAGTENRILFFSGSELASCIKISFSLGHRISNNWGVLKKKKNQLRMTFSPKCTL